MSLFDADQNEDEALNALFTCLAGRDRRRLLELLYDRSPSPVPRSDLATTLAAWRHQKQPATVTDAERQRALVALYHKHLPTMDAAGLVEQATDGDGVTVTDHPAFEDRGVRSVLRDETTADSDSLDALFEALADASRRTILDVLSHQYQPIQLETLASDVVAREHDKPERAVTPDEREQLLGSLRHVHLPKLRAADLVEYDPDEQTVAYEGHPDLRVPWMHSHVGDDFRTTLSESPEGAAVWDIGGREQIVSCGQSLCDEAAEELFLMFTTTGLLEAGCFTRIAQAADRGVDVYLGTCDPTVREFVQENAPEVTLWEPETDWLNLPVDDDSVGRLVFADREAVMIGTLGEKDDDGVHEEQAIFGQGENNALVVMLRQMLASRLARFDAEDETLDAQLQF